MGASTAPPLSGVGWRAKLERRDRTGSPVFGRRPDKTKLTFRQSFPGSGSKKPPNVRMGRNYIGSVIFMETYAPCRGSNGPF
jgi:hypothetical protein